MSDDAARGPRYPGLAVVLLAGVAASAAEAGVDVVADPDVVTVPVYLREKKTGSSYAPTNLFGQPLLVSLPQSTTVASLYEALLVRMSRYVERPASEDEWWRPPPKTESGPESMEQARVNMLHNTWKKSRPFE